MTTQVSTTELEKIAFQRITDDSFLDADIDFNYSYGTFTGYLQITSTIAVDFTDSRFCLTDEGIKVAEISRELEVEVENYLNTNYLVRYEAERKYELADIKTKSQKEDHLV